MAELSVAVVGLGVGEAHARAYRATGRCELRWLFDLDRDRSERLARELGAGVADSFDEVIDDPEVEAVSIASYDDAHFEQVLAALRAGKHVFAEKPLCRTVDELVAIKNAWTAHGGRIKLASNLVLRAAPLYRWLKQRIDAGSFGRIYAIDGDYLYGRLDRITDGWRAGVEDYSVILGGGIHLVDLVLWLTGERPTGISATGNRIATRGTPFRYDDFVSATMRFPSGLIGRITANFGCVHRHQHVLRIFGTNATFILDDAGPRLHDSRDPSVTAAEVTLPTLPGDKGDLIAPFVEAILNDEDLGTHTQEFFDGISICSACDAALHSSGEREVRYV